MSHNELLGSHIADDGRYLSPLPLTYGSSKQPALMWSSPINDTGIIGSRKILKCIFGGVPTPQVIWSHPSKHPSSHPSKHPFELPLNVTRGNEFVIPKLTIGDGGTYECRALNGAGVASNFIHLRVHAKPQWDTSGKPPSLIEIDVCSNVSIECNVYAAPPPSLQWFLDGTPIQRNQNPRITVEEETLSVNNATVKDGGTFQCQASNVHGSIISNTVIVVRESHPYFDEQPQDKKTVVGRNVTLSCRVKGAPKPEVRWYRGHLRSRVINGIKFSIHPSGSLKITNVQKTDEGMYFCVASNKLSEIESSATLTVKDGPKMPSGSALVIASNNESVSIPCDVLFEDDSKTIWYRDEKKIHLEDHHDDTRMKLRGRNLDIYGIEVGDAGMYRCAVEWGGEEVARSRAVKVVIAGVPDAPINLSIFDCSSDPFVVKMSWMVGSSNHKDISSCHVHLVTLKNSSGHQGSPVISVVERKRFYRPFEVAHESIRVQPWTDYLFRVACSNQEGSSGLSHPIGCRTPSIPPSRNPFNVCVELAGTNQMLVVWQPLTEDELNGDNFHYVVSYRPMHLNGPFTKVILNGFNQSQVTISDLEPFTLFLISVASANHEGQLKVMPDEYAFGYSSEKVPELTPLRFRVEWSNGSEIKFAWTSHGEKELGAFIRGFQIKIWKRTNSDEFLMKDIESGQRSRKCGKHVGSKPPKLNEAFEMHEVIGLQWSDVEVVSVIRYLTEVHRGPSSHQISFRVSAGSPQFGLKLEELGTNHAILKWKCLPRTRSGKYSHRISLVAGFDKSVPLQSSYIQSNHLCSHLIKVRDLQSSSKYRVNITSIERANKDELPDSIVITTKAFYVPDEPIIENIEFVDITRINVILAPSNNPPSDYCIQFKNEVATNHMSEWTKGSQCKSLQHKNCSPTNGFDQTKSSHFEFLGLEDELRKISMELPLETSFVRIISSNLIDNCSLAQTASAPFKLLSGSNKESMLHREMNDTRGKTIIWLIVVGVLFVLCLVVLAAVFLCINSWRGQVYSVRSSEKCGRKKSKSNLDPLDGRSIHRSSPKIRPDGKLLETLKDAEDFWKEGSLASYNYNDYVEGETTCRTPPVANTLV